jgi:hypothetical protein
VDEKHPGDTGAGGVITFRFANPEGVELGFFDMKVVELDPAEQVLWQVVGGPDEWIGTRVSWQLKQDGDYCIVLFKHQGWKEPVDFMHHCSTKWAIFLMSLKALVETGQAARRARTTSRSTTGTDRSAIDKVFKALADPTRRRLLDQLHGRTARR